MKKGLLLILAILIITSNVAYGTRGDTNGALELTDIENHYSRKSWFSKNHRYYCYV